MTLRGRVAVTPRSLSTGHLSLGRLTDAGLEVVFPSRGRTPTHAELLEVLPDCVAYLAGVEPVTAELIAASPRLRVIVRNGVGVDNVDLAAAANAGIEVRTTPGANTRGVAELAVALLFSAARHIPAADHALKKQTWTRQVGFELQGRTLGVIGLGAIGRSVAALTDAIGMRVLGHDPCPLPSWRAPAGFRWADLDELLATADMVTLHLPPGDRPLVDAEFLARMRPGAVLVNTSRAELVDFEAAKQALDSGHLASYAVDTFTPEPPADWTLASHERVIATPHVGGLTTESVDRASGMAVDQILAALRGQAATPQGGTP